MAGFKGQAEYSVDGKGRVAIPAKMRNAMNPASKNTFVVTRGFEKCIFLYPLDHWEKMEEDIQGRIGIPKPLQEFAGISDKAMILGAFDHIEIWDPGLFEQYMNGQSEDYVTLAERVMGT